MCGYGHITISENIAIRNLLRSKRNFARFHNNRMRGIGFGNSFWKISYFNKAFGIRFYCNFTFIGENIPHGRQLLNAYKLMHFTVTRCSFLNFWHISVYRDNNIVVFFGFPDKGSILISENISKLVGNIFRPKFVKRVYHETEGIQVFAFAFHEYTFIIFSPVTDYIFPVVTIEAFIGNNTGVQIHVILITKKCLIPFGGIIV